MVAFSPHIKQLNYHKYKHQLFGATAGAATFAGAFLLIGELAPVSNSSAERINVNIGDGAYYMNISASDLDIDIDATPAGVTKTVQEDIKVTTNSGTGYKLYLSMNNDNANGNRLYYNGNTTETSYIIPTTSTSLDTNSWGFSKDGTNFSAVPLQGSETVIGSADSTPASTVTHSIYYGFNVNNTLPFGQYSGVVLYTAVADAASSPKAKTSVANYLDDKSMADPAGGDTLVITTSLMTNMANLGDVSVSVGGTNCPVTNTTTANKYAEVSCTLPAKTAGTYSVAVTLAKFDKTYDTTITYNDDLFGVGMKKIRTMQGMTSEVCDNISTPAAFTTGTTFNTDVPKGRLRDTRDANSYNVKKLADGNCWMDQNLNLDFGTPDSSGTTNTTFKLTSADTDINYGNYKGSTATADNEWMPGRNTQLSSSGTWTSEVAYSFTFRDDEYTGGAHSSGTSGRYWNNGSGYSSTIGSYGVRNHFGNYYTLAAATAGTGVGLSKGEDAGDSICPKGWRLISWPAFVDTLSKYNITLGTTNKSQVIAEPLHFINSGWRYAGGGLDRQGEGMRFYSSTVVSSGNLYTLGTQQDYSYVMESGAGASGAEIRCVAR